MTEVAAAAGDGAPQPAGRGVQRPQRRGAYGRLEPRRLLTRLAPLLSGAALTGCGTPTPPPALPPQVQLVQPRPMERVDSATYQSTLEAIRELRLAPEIAGRIVAMPVFEGQLVKPGQLLFTLDQVQLTSQVNADAAEARKNQVNAERYIFLNEQGAVSTKDRDFYVTQAIQSRDKLRASMATLGYKNVVAPIGGYVGNLNYKLGDVVQAGSVITSVVDNSKLWLRIDVPAELSDRVRPGQPVLLQGPDPRRPRAIGQVVFIAPSLDKEKQTLLVKAAFNNPSGSLRNNERVSATVLFSRQPVLAIPEQAVLLQAGKSFVFLAVSLDEAQMRLGRKITPAPPANLPVVVQVPVRLGTLQGGAYPVLGGLRPQDAVVLGRLAQLRSGLAVQPGAGMAPPASTPGMAASTKAAKK
ncbi:MAG: efflux RND transporter periplasmic adaptor subunit [Synechococcaceae cyanobacterium]